MYNLNNRILKGGFILNNLVMIHPVFKQLSMTAEHPEGELSQLGDALGRDFVIAKFIDGFLRTYLNDGKRNEDWFCYQVDVLAPCDAIVEKVNVNTEENNPGSHTNTPSGSVVFRREDGVRIAYGHVRDIQVEVNDKVAAGQVFAKCGNNGTSWSPHIHVGAWKENQPLQIVVDLQVYGKLQREQGNIFSFLENDEETKELVSESFKQ